MDTIEVNDPVLTEGSLVRVVVTERRSLVRRVVASRRSVTQLIEGDTLVVVTLELIRRATLALNK